LKEEKYRVPEDMSMVSFDDQPYSAFLSTPMTTVSQQSHQIGQIAAKLIIEQIESKKHVEQESIQLPTKLIIRGSVKKKKTGCFNCKSLIY
jgi:LacI family transcriptional regulator